MWPKASSSRYLARGELPPGLLEKDGHGGALAAALLLPRLSAPGPGLGGRGVPQATAASMAWLATQGCLSQPTRDTGSHI